MQAGRNLPKGTRGFGVKWQSVEVGLDLLENSLSIGPLSGGGREEWPDRELRKCDSRDERFVGQDSGILQC